MIGCLDPGVKEAGVSLWEGTELAAAFLARGSDWRDTADEAFRLIGEHVPRELVSVIVVEIPQIYAQRKLKGDPNDLITVALNAGAFVGHWDDDVEIVEYHPHRWKGQVPKNIAIKRFKKRLSADERTRVEKAPATLMHNVWDSVGLGLYYGGRR